MYSPTTARWMSRDPLGVAGGDTNSYRYVFNSPTRIGDPSGLKPTISPNYSVCCKFDNGSERWSETVSCSGQTAAQCCANRASGWFYNWKVVSSTYGDCFPDVPGPDWHCRRNDFNKCPRNRPGGPGAISGGIYPDESNTCNWRYDGIAALHGGAACYRGTGKCANYQCCYDENGNLINSGNNQGTYDYVAPYGESGRVSLECVVTVPGHILCDVIPGLVCDNALGYDYTCTPPGGIYSGPPKGPPPPQVPPFTPPPWFPYR